MMTQTPFVIMTVLVISLGLIAPPIYGAETTRVSVATGDLQGIGESEDAAVSGDGRYVAFESDATLVPGDINGVQDVFIHDRQAGTTTLGSVATGGLQGNDTIFSPALNADSRFVSFHSPATNLVAGDTNTVRDVFVHDRQTGITTRVSIATGGVQGNDASRDPALSGDGRFVTFASDATNLVAGDTNAVRDVFVHDRQTGTTTRVSIATGGVQGNDESDEPALSGDGRFVAFLSFATNLVPGDTNGEGDVFVHDRQTGITTRVNVATGGQQANDFSCSPAISTDGRFVAFFSDANNLVPGDTNGARDIFAHDQQTGTTTRVSVATGGLQGNDNSFGPALNANGRFVAYHSFATNLVPGDTNAARDVFVHDRHTGSTTRVSVATGGVQGNDTSRASALSGDGRYVTFESDATNLVPGDTNAVRDVFVHDRGLASITSSLAAAVLPGSRSVQVGIAGTAFATIINAGTTTATGCGIAPITALSAAFTFQTTDPNTNALTGTPNTPVDIPAGQFQTFLFAFTPTTALTPTDVQLAFDCSNTDPASVTTGLNTLLLSASSTPIPDIVALAATPTGDGIVNLMSTGGFAVATVNVGASASITATADSGSATLPVSLALCETDPGTGACINPTVPTTGPVTTQVNAGATPTFAIFVTGTGTVPFDPANNRIFVRFKDAGAVTRGATSVAVRTQ